jgi:hypothetical protein
MLSTIIILRVHILQSLEETESDISFNDSDSKTKTLSDTSSGECETITENNSAMGEPPQHLLI